MENNTTTPPARKGARTIATIPPEVLTQLNQGAIQTANLVEWLAINHEELLANFLNQNKRTSYMSNVTLRIQALKKRTVNTVNEAIGVSLYESSVANNDTALIPLMANHTSDTIRCWAAYSVANNKALSLPQMLSAIQAYAADKHFGVREIAWLVVRPLIANNLTQSITLLTQWTKHKDPNIRRFASEVTRPRGVWCAHIETLKQNPGLCLNILTPLNSDPAKYVQDSVANWLNDASKTKPEFVQEICDTWLGASKTKETAYIVKKAMRTIDK
jgi:3-methyladenine DNA glycosylase AlkC